MYLFTALFRTIWNHKWKKSHKWFSLSSAHESCCSCQSALEDVSRKKSLILKEIHPQMFSFLFRIPLPLITSHEVESVIATLFFHPSSTQQDLTSSGKKKSSVSKAKIETKNKEFTFTAPPFWPLLLFLDDFHKYEWSQMEQCEEKSIVWWDW